MTTGITLAEELGIDAFDCQTWPRELFQAYANACWPGAGTPDPRLLYLSGRADGIAYERCRAQAEAQAVLAEEVGE